MISQKFVEMFLHLDRHTIKSASILSTQSASLFRKPPIALRTFSEYMNRLIELDLVRWDRALVRGKVRVFKLP
jgi:hypothetical protein